MTRLTSIATSIHKAFARCAIAAFVAALALGLAALAPPASAAAPSKNDQACLACHGSAGLEKHLADGATLSLHIAGDNFAKSVHGAIGCTGCHTDINLATHLSTPKPIASKRAFSLEMIHVCRTCHSTQFGQWDKSVHAALVHDGNPAAPICTSCHSPHAVIKGVAETMDTVPCRACHGAIFDAYAKSVHGMMRSKGVTAAPLCFSCHGAHAVHVPSEVQGLRDVCLGCHKGALEAHRKWLPNVDLHFDVVSCVACHVPNARRRVDLVLFNSGTQKADVRPEGVPEFQSPDGTGTAAQPGLDAATLFNLLKALNRPGVENKTVVKGRLEVSTAVEAHEIAFSSNAISDCSVCHRAGANAFQSVVVSVAGPAGIPILYGASKSVLSSAFSIESIGGFYAIGGTRVTFLDVLLVLALLGGFGIPAAHLFLRFAVPRFRILLHHEQRKR
ncbi:MAG TPA: hypothetical protein VMF53_13860 [Alphaproteobacteria bacterium]|nr:hypothetical protein [Alphaproteobacteria bacterium]